MGRLLDISAPPLLPSHAMPASREKWGLAFAGLCALNGAFVPAFAVLTTARANAFFVATVSCLFAAVAALAVLAARGEVAVLWRRGQAPWLLLIGLLGTALAHTLFFLGAERTSAIETALCVQVEPVYSLIVSRVFLGHRLTRRRVLAALVALFGIALAIGAQRARTGAGILLLLATPLCWQASHVIVLSRLRGISPPVLTGARYVYGGLLLSLFFGARALVAPAGAALPPPDVLPSLMPLLALQGVVLAYVGTNLWYQAIARLDLARTTAIVVPSIPLLSFAASFVLLGEVASTTQWLGLAFTAAGVLAFVTGPDALQPGEHIPAPTAPLLTPDAKS
jgi:probable blue pigment (indigoidine) exporter